jgi:hypothetical protein
VDTSGSASIQGLRGSKLERHARARHQELSCAPLNCVLWPLGVRNYNKATRCRPGGMTRHVDPVGQGPPVSSSLRRTSWSPPCRNRRAELRSAPSSRICLEASSSAGRRRCRQQICRWSRGHSKSRSTTPTKDREKLGGSPQGGTYEGTSTSLLVDIAELRRRYG